MPQRSNEERTWIINRYLETKSSSRVIQEGPFLTPPLRKQTILDLVKKFLFVGNVNTRKGDNRKSHTRSPLSLANAENVILQLVETPNRSITKIAAQHGVPLTSAWGAARDDGLRCFHPIWVQELRPKDLIDRLQFSHTTLDMFQNDQEYMDSIWWGDEASFNLSGSVNRRDEVIWGFNNPHELREVQMKSSSLSVWAAISSQGIIGPYFFHRIPEEGEYVHSSIQLMSHLRLICICLILFYLHLMHLYDLPQQ